MEELKWLKDCELCNVGVCNTIDDYQAQGLSIRAAAEKMEQECEGLWSASKIRDRYRYYKQGHSGGGNPPSPDNRSILEWSQQEWDLASENMTCQEKWKLVMRSLSWAGEYNNISHTQHEDCANWMKSAAILADEQAAAKFGWSKKDFHPDASREFPETACWNLHVYILTRPKLPDDMWELLMKADSNLFDLLMAKAQEKQK